MANGTDGRPTKNQRREEAREQARITREKQAKKEKRNRVFLQSGVAVALVAIAAVVVLLVVQAVQPPGPGPRNMASGGLVVGAEFKAQTTPALQPDEDPVVPKPDRENGPIDIVLYADYMCPACGAFEQQNAPLIQPYVGNGEATLEIRPVAFLDRFSSGTKYSTRAANAFACVADSQPDLGYEYHNRLLSAEVQPAENSTGLTNAQLLEQMEAVNIKVDDKMKSCVNDGKFSSFVTASSTRAGSEPVPNSDLQKVSQTPTVIVNGEFLDTQTTTLNDLILKHFKETSTDETATPTPSPTPAG